MASTKSIHKLLLEQLEGGNAHVDFDQAVKGLSYKQAGIEVEGVPYTIWELIEHIRIAQEDILEFCQNPNYEKIDWPEDYWPESSAPSSKEDYEGSVKVVSDGIDEMKSLVLDPKNDPQAVFDHGSGQTLFREAMLIVDHSSYHIGQIVLIRRLLGNW